METNELIEKQRQMELLRYKRILVKWLNGKRLGLVFSGGGAKGAYQVGAWKALREFGITDRVVAVSGTSVGALNGFMFSYSDYEFAEELWLEHIDQRRFMSVHESDHLLGDLASVVKGAMLWGWLPLLLGPLSQSTLVTFNPMMVKLYDIIQNRSMFSNEGIGKLVDSVYRDGKLKIKRRSIDLYACSYEFMTLKARYFCLQPWKPGAREMLLASASIPLVYPPVKLNMMHYHDGGCVDNIPVKPLEDNKLDLVLAVNIDGDCPPKDLQEAHPDIPIIEIRPLEYLGGMKRAMEFNHDYVKRLIDSGYKDTKQILIEWAQMLNSQGSMHDVLPQLRSWIKSNLKKYPSNQSVTLESLAHYIKDFHMLTGNGLNLLPNNFKTGYGWKDLHKCETHALQKNGRSYHHRVVDHNLKTLSWGSEITQYYKYWKIRNPEAEEGTV